MLYVMNIILFLLAKKVVSASKFMYVVIGCIFIFVAVSFVIISDDFLLFMVLFEALFFPIVFVSLYFNFNNRFIYAIFYLIIFSSCSSIVCMIVCIVCVFYFNVVLISILSDLCFMDSVYLLVYVWCLLYIMFAIKYPV